MENQQSIAKDRKNVLSDMIQSIDFSKLTREDRINAHREAIKVAEFSSLEYDLTFYGELYALQYK